MLRREKRRIEDDFIVWITFFKALFKKDIDRWLSYAEKLFAEGHQVAGFTAYQREIIKKILGGSADTYVLIWSRQTGKTSIVGFIALMYVLLNYPRRVQVLLVAPILRHSQNLFRSVLRALEGLSIFYDAESKTGFVRTFVKRMTLTLVEFGWGAFIVCLPAKKIRGQSASLMIIDEAAYLPEASWQEILPMLKVKRKERTIFILTSTPTGTNTRFYRVWMEGANNGEQGFPFHVTYKDCPFSEKEKIEEDLKTGLLTENEFRREYLAEFVSGEGQAIPDEYIESALDDYKTFKDEDFVM